MAATTSYAWTLRNTTEAGGLPTFSIRANGRPIGLVERVRKGTGFVVSLWDRHEVDAVFPRAEVRRYYFPTAFAYREALKHPRAYFAG